MYFGLHEQVCRNVNCLNLEKYFPYFRFMSHFSGAYMFLFLCSMILAGCGGEKPINTFDFSSLTGSWSSVNSEASQIEEWQEKNDSIYLGRGYVLESGDTTFLESLEIRRESGVWTYYAKVNQLNGTEVVSFVLSKQTHERVEFTNLSHDFPKKIGYELLSQNELQAYIEGPRDGQNIRILFDYKRNL